MMIPVTANKMGLYDISITGDHTAQQSRSAGHILIFLELLE
jgi:hypothetical protein